MTQAQMNLSGRGESVQDAAAGDARYSGDQPNQHLYEFAERHLHERPYDPETDDYEVANFDHPIDADRANAVYKMNRYWSKKSYDAIREFIRHYTDKDDLVLDPFCGSGSTALSALLEHRKAIAIDRSPAATYITRNYCDPVSGQELKRAFAELEKEIKPELDRLYETRCDRCGGKAVTKYTVYSQVFQCPRCMEKVALYDCPELKTRQQSGDGKAIRVCPHCHARGIEEEIKTSTRRFGEIPVLVKYECLNGCKPKTGTRSHIDPDKKKRDYFEKYDLGKLEEIAAKEIPYWYPGHRMMNVESDSDPWGVEWAPGRDFRTIAELYTKRNLWALGVYRNAINKIKDERLRTALLFAFINTVHKASRLMGHNSDGAGRIMHGTYYIPQIIHDTNACEFINSAVRRIAKGFDTIHPDARFVISTDDARKLHLPSDSVDYIFTDPPYAGKIQYGELNFLWEAWLDLDTHWHDDEIIINTVRDKTEEDWADAMQLAMDECCRVLKPGRCISLCYHDSSEGSWALIQDIMAKAGFRAEKTDAVISIDTAQKSFNQQHADKITRRDLVINFRKPKPGDVSSTVINGDEEKGEFADKARAIITTFLESHPGSGKDRIWDDLASRMVRKGQMEPHNFEALLRQVAEEIKAESVNGPSRWYLREADEERRDAAEAELEDQAAALIADYIRESFAARFPARISGRANTAYFGPGIHYSDLFEFYISNVANKPRRLLADFLPDYFYKTDDGGWRNPMTDEESEQKAQGRTAALGRRIRRYVSLLKSGAPVETPGSATLADWLRYCKNAGLYNDGVLLYERGGLELDNLPAEMALDVEESYEICKSRLNNKKTSS